MYILVCKHHRTLVLYNLLASLFIIFISVPIFCQLKIIFPLEGDPENQEVFNTDYLRQCLWKAMTVNYSVIVNLQSTVLMLQIEYLQFDLVCVYLEVSPTELSGNYPYVRSA